MKKLNYKIVSLVALGISSVLLVSGCATVQQASSAVGSTGTGVIAGVAAGAGTGVLCDKLTHGKSTGACVAAGAVVGTAVGAWAASFDAELEKAVPSQDCATIKRRMDYSSTATKPKAVLKLSQGKSPLVVKPGEKLKITLKMDLATPGKAGNEQELPFKTEIKTGAETIYGDRPYTKNCGGDYELNPTLPTEKEGVYKSNIKLLNVDGSEIAGGNTTFCYTVSNDSKDKCPNSTQATLEKPVALSNKSSGRKTKKII